jgi:hypothetical protein
MSEVILLGAGTLVSAILILILVVALDSILGADLRPKDQSKVEGIRHIKTLTLELENGIQNLRHRAD